MRVVFFFFFFIHPIGLSAEASIEELFTKLQNREEHRSEVEEKKRDIHLSICFFSMNNSREYQEAKYFFEKKLNPQSKIKFHVEEFVPYAEYPDFAFKKMITSKSRCDGLVISGHHHPKGFEGYRVTGYLPTNWLSEQSCHPQIYPWFAQIKAVWLQGCATSKRSGNKKSLLHHKFAKIFPNANLFSWSGSAPSRAAHLTIPYQIANLAGISKGKSLEWPFSEIDKLDAQKMAEKTIGLLLGNSPSAVESWLKIRKQNSQNNYGVYNFTAQAFPALFFEDKDNLFRKSREFSCRLNFSKSDRIKRLQWLKQIIEQKELIHLSVQDLLREILWNKDEKYLNDIRSVFKQSDLLVRTIFSEINNEKANSILDRVSYYHLYQAIFQKRNLAWEKQLLASALKELNRSQKAYDKIEQRYRNQRIILALLKEVLVGKNLMQPTFLESLNSRKAIRASLRVFNMVHPRERTRFLVALLNNKNIDSDLLYQITWNLRIIRPNNLQNIMRKILQHPMLSTKTKRIAQSN